MSHKVDLVLANSTKIVSEYDQEIPQSQTADNPVTPRGRAARSTITRHQEDKLSKATSSLFPVKMIAILERTQSNVQQNIEQLQTPTMGVTINKNQQQQNHGLRTDSSLSHRGLKCILLVPNPAEMQYYAAFHLVVHCLPKYPFRGFKYKKGLKQEGPGALGRSPEND